MYVPPMENPTCAAFEKYGEVTKKGPLDFLEDDITLVTLKLSGVAGALGLEAIELRNWLLHFGCVSEEIRVVDAKLENWMSNSSVNLTVRVDTNKRESKTGKILSRVHILTVTVK